MHIKKGLAESDGYELLEIMNHLTVFSHNFLTSYQACLRAVGHFHYLFEHMEMLHITVN